MEEQKIKNIRHSLSHLMTMAVLEIYPDAGLGVGPTIDDGFYQDYDLPETINQDILLKLEKRIKQMIKENIKFEQHSMGFDEALKLYKNDPYKTELINDLKITGEKEVSFYRSDKFDNLCKGPHVESTKEINPNAFKLDRIAGAYWRGDEKNKMLTRIYGIAFGSKEELDEYLMVREEAKKRDHRKIGRELDLFHIDEEVGLGLVLWHPKGALLWRIMEDFWYQEHLKADYDLVRSPHIGNRKLWEKSGHWGFYNASMYPPLEAGQSLEEAQDNKKAENSEQYLLKPMNCPFHVKIYNSNAHSYRDLPYRWAETGTVYRFEKTGELSGLTRVRGFTQDDAHIICRKEQVEKELKRVIDFILFIYKSFGFEKGTVNVYLSLRDPENKKKYAGDDAGWDFTEEVLRKVAKEKKLNFKEELGEAAFYGPKLDFKVKDGLGREWQCSTLQFDFNLPQRFEMKFVNEKGEEEQPYMLHRALMGSFERFIGLLIEHYAGAFPVWLSPTQVEIIPVSTKHIKPALKLAKDLREEGVRVHVDEANETVGYKIRKAEKQKAPYMLVIGDREAKGKKLSVRERGKKDNTEMSLKKFIETIKEEIKKRK
ncbi:threonine--tRNA ligase [Candidatus Falkowbacteria bacterium RIFOXYB2_FULL_38_15]|uniref:Threonine--tRNA ligase n=1 Tax=Candidatus Falkowbacteria bacterium RIFOXYA2_FULL_38_12 TaxID=1797993 RepID=A0A1F5S2J7_9BACT|nr:MAG: threonine--tRNA ligase [Candidatus Falkowbacteria bacterium RIFOXYA2_FULL_38_12]OGF33584.1 MAG: threonine--tRNA ligase [Candidatus Falkowbacteria bacterium RIFOXYB2_FULL_38_15]OGF42605.1 MAG: threonine--tRNA ligase [Candidatus Falkowbacteria bacterium RIFOXYD2_FULL_39_16]